MVKSPARTVCWWGKLPTHGDFVGRGLPARWRSAWDDWLQRGLALAAAELDGPALRERLRAFAPWRYVALPASGELWCGIVLPSQDRVGRAFPLTLAERLAASAAPHDIAARLASLLDAAAQGPEALEAAIARLPPPAVRETHAPEAWPALPSSAWWPLAAGSDTPARIAAWPPEPALLLEVLGIQAAEHQTASAE